MKYDITYTNALGDTIDFSKDEHIKLVAFEGFGEVEASVQTQKSPYQNGSTLIGSQLEERYPYIDFFIEADTWEEVTTIKRKIAKVFNPALTGTFTAFQGGFSSQIKGIPEHVPNFPDNHSETVQRVTVDFVCPNPYWQDINPTNIKLEDYVDNFSFPFSFPVSFSLRGDTRNIINAGHVETPVKVTFVGESVNPKITKNNTGEFIKVNRTIPSGYSLVINTDFDNKSVEIVAPDGISEDAMGYIDLDSDFFMLDVGDNHLSFITDGGNPEVYVEYRNWFVGI